MPRKAFISDLQEAIRDFERNNITDLKPGEEDGTISFKYHTHDDNVTEVTVLVPDLGEYPDSHMYMMYTDSQNVPQSLHDALDAMSDCQGMKVIEMMVKVSKTFDKATAGSRHNPVDLEDGDPMVIDSADDLDDSDDEGGYDTDPGGWSPQSPKHHSSTTYSRTGDRSQVKAMNKRIRQDLSVAKEAGLRVGYHGSLLNGGLDGFVTISCRVSKLGISEEALQAWHLESKQYFLLLIRYTAGYKSLDRLLGSDLNHGGSGVQLRTGLSDRYKIAIDEAIAAFTLLEDKSKSSKLMNTTDALPKKTNGIGRLFIGRPMEELLNDRLIPLLRYRMAMAIPWGGAEQFFNDHQGCNLSGQGAVDAKYWAEDPSSQIQALPKIVTQDHLNDRTKEYSFPLLAMQFALRHLVRCTEFCLVCHCKVEADFEALKPYVCSKPLCLYQYMSLGFGPSIEHEIITQPHVVDLLISFCYTSACYSKLRYLPTGMALMVPSPAVVSHAESLRTGYQYDIPGNFPGMSEMNKRSATYKPSKAHQFHSYKAKFDQARMELIFSAGSQKVLHTGTWITFVPTVASSQRWHCRVTEVLHPIVKLGEPVIRSAKKGLSSQQQTVMSVSTTTLGNTNISNLPSTMTPATTPPPCAKSELPSALSYQQIEFAIYEQNFDDLDDSEKQGSICLLLDTLPSVPSMSTYLRSKGGQETFLRSWVDRVSPAALGLLRWIIASNRSCIIQVDSLDGSTRRAEERVAGMPGWMQFRFAQGAPDKEQRFVTSIRRTTPQAKYPTMFAWHGSPLHNWHGIVREGLHFENSDHGRAFGNGCYHSLQCATSMGYSGMNHMYRSGQGGEPDRPGEWPQSQLRISQAIALNEIVNAPSQFVSKSPHLVVAQLDWIQSRYLFVRCNMQGMHIADNVPEQTYEQDPSYTPVGERGDKVLIPLTAVSKSRRPASKTVTHGNKKVKIDNMQDLEEAVMLSDETDYEDVAIFFPDEDEQNAPDGAPSTGKGKEMPKAPLQQTPDKSKTDFTPGSLDHKSLPLLEPPSYATSMATKALQRELTATLKVQDTYPAHELGWYIDPELVNNVYQWIVELHSFETHLPLAKDLKSKGIKSVVMEIRFGKDYPMSPPFVRVIRPRFLSFMQGGGGHVTAGGALCMELLTNSGWSAVSNIESVLLQVRLAMSSTDPKPARLEPGASVRDYAVGEAIDAYIRACNAHGWEVPSDFRSMSSGASGSRSLLS